MLFRSLRSSPITEPSSLLRTLLPLCPASVLWRLPGLPTCASPFTSGRQVLTFLTKAQSTFTPPLCRTPTEHSTGSSRSSSQGRITAPISTSSWVFRHVIDGSLSFVSIGSHLTQSLPRLFPQRSPPRLFTPAACGGLKSAPASRLRRAYLHLW